MESSLIEEIIQKSRKKVDNCSFLKKNSFQKKFNMKKTIFF